jgi:hypothetical protein
MTEDEGIGTANKRLCAEKLGRFEIAAGKCIQHVRLNGFTL